MAPWMTALARLLPGRDGRTVTPVDSKASRVGPLIAFETLRRPVWAPRDYTAFAREGFMQNAVVYRSVRMIAEAAASVPLVLYDGAHDLDEHPLLDLLNNPSPQQTQAGFFESWYGFLLVSGNAYVEAVGVGSDVRELHVLRPDRMKVIPGSEGWPEAYEYSVNGQSLRFEGDVVPGVAPILHQKLFHPDNDHYGMSPIEAASTAIDIHNAASVWNKALLDNSARPSGALVYAASDGRMTAEQFDRLKLEMEQGFAGPKQAGRPLLLEGGLDWKPLSLSPKDMDFIEAKNAAAREIALALGVPPMLLGIPGDNTYSNYQEANRSFWRQTVLPLVHRSSRAIASWLAPAYGGALALRADMDQIEALSSEREALWARLDRSTFLTLDEKRAAVGYGPLPAAETPPPFDDPASRGSRSSQPASLKYSQTQPRAPAGSSDGGQWVAGLVGRPVVVDQLRTAVLQVAMMVASSPTQTRMTSQSLAQRRHRGGERHGLDLVKLRLAADKPSIFGRWRASRCGKPSNVFRKSIPHGSRYHEYRTQLPSSRRRCSTAILRKRRMHEPHLWSVAVCPTDSGRARTSSNFNAIHQP
jgi:HK97 family phage portal protein